jgi:ABC-type Zn uptake system ZnuABC Zn-binding protein ZnuA
VGQIVARIPQQRRKLVTTHDSLGYFADRYGFEVVGCVLDSVTTEASDPSAKHMANLIALVKASETPVVFAESPGNPQLMEQIAREAQVRVVYDLYSCGLVRPGSPGDTYIGMIRSNARTIADCLLH